MSDIYQYKLHCSTESLDKTVWRDENEGAPTTCPTNTNHTIVSESVRVINKRSQNLMKLKEENVDFISILRY